MCDRPSTPDAHDSDAGSAIALIGLEGESSRSVDDFKIAVVVQFRPPLNGFSMELPAGIVENDGLTAEQLIIKELKEETGTCSFWPRILDSRTRRAFFVLQPSVIAGSWYSK